MIGFERSFDGGRQMRSGGRASRRSGTGGEFGGTRLLLLLVAALTTRSSGGADVEPDVIAALREEGEVRVMVVADAGRPASSASAETLAERCRRFERAQEEILAQLPAHGYEMRYRYRYSPCLFLSVRDGAVLEALRVISTVRLVRADRVGHASLAESRLRIGADAVQAAGYEGAGLTVAVIDSGVAAGHADLADAVVHEWHYLEQGQDIGEGASDETGHGTNVSGIIASRGRDGAPGIAPAAQLVVVRVLDRFNAGWFSDWAAGLEHAVELHQTDNGIELTAINLSLASRDRFEDICDDEFPELFGPADAARELGILVVAASGNGGNSTRIASPACLDPVVAVGATFDTTVRETIWPRTDRNRLVDLLAPGAAITSAGIDADGGSTFLGTSQAAPHVAAGAAILREMEPAITPDEILAAFRSSGVPVMDAESGLVIPLLDLESAARLVSTGVASAHFRRGDVSDDAALDLTDAVQILNWLFLGGVTPRCVEAADTDGNSRIDISDAVILLSAVFLDGPPPPRPGRPPQACGIDPDEPGGDRDLGCAEYTSC